jgi:hypothetical protein
MFTGTAVRFKDEVLAYTCMPAQELALAAGIRTMRMLKMSTDSNNILFGY